MLQKGSKIYLSWYRRKQNLVKHQKVSKHYENGCLLNFLLLFISLLAVPIVKRSHIWARI